MGEPKLDRRKFLKHTTLSALGAGVAVKGLAVEASPPKEVMPRIREYRTFGRTGFRVSDISSGNPSNEVVLRALLDNGVNLIDTGETYANGNSERLIGRVISDRDRSELFINTKLYTEKSFPSKKEVLKRAYDSLDRLGTDYVDCMMIHSAENTQILKDKAFHSAMRKLKKEGKVRHVGVSCHGSNWAVDTEEGLATILLEAVNDGRFDVILMAYNFANADRAERVLEACEKRNIAVIIMKSNPVYIYGIMEKRVTERTRAGKKVNDYTQMFYDKYKAMVADASAFFKSYGIHDDRELRDAASKFVLSDPRAHTTVWDFRNFDDVRHMLSLSGQKLTVADKDLLKGYLEHLGPLTCRIGCNDCETACPHHIPVNRILRYNYYFTVKGEEKRAMEKFARLEGKKPSEVCLGCEGYCEKACHYGVSARYLLAEAQQNLEFAVS
jgi:predicted aldo/keto reductase-like oxidoreductase